MHVLVVTTGNPERLTGGYLYIKRMQKGLESFGDTVSVLSIPSRSFPWSLASTWRLAKSLSTLKPDVVLVDTGMAGPSAAPLLLFPHICESPIAALLLQPRRDKANSDTATRLLEGFLLRRAARVIVPGFWMAAALRATGVQSERVSVVRPGCDTPGPNSRTKTQANGEVRFLCAANWLPGKGIVDLIRTFGRPELSGSHLDLVGDQTMDRVYSQRVHLLIDELELKSRVRTPGAAPWEEMAQYYCQADVFVLPSYSEGLPLSCCEAYRFGLPVVGYRIPGLAEIVSDGVDGILVPAGDVLELSAALSSLATDPFRLAQLSAGARSKGDALPTWDDSAKKLRKMLPLST